MIDYGLIQEASNFYRDSGYVRIESPWLVTEGISNITKPLGASSYIVQKDTEENKKVFVASGEQSFLYLINKGFLPSGRYQTITPCLRNDDFDDIHTKYFMKLELIHFDLNDQVEPVDMENMVQDALDFFKTKTIGKFDQPIEQKNSVIESDINYKDVEIGSYGIRHTSFVSWVYGTGLAEPRFSRLLRSK